MRKFDSGWDTITENDQILVPTATGYYAYSVLSLLGWDYNRLGSASGFGLAPLHFITQRGPVQDGETPLDMRWDTRVIQIVISEFFANRTRFFDKRWTLVDLLRPNRAFDTTAITPLIYRKWLPGGLKYRATDMVTYGTTTVTSYRGKFVHNGLRTNKDDPTNRRGFVLTVTEPAGIAGTYHVLDVPNDYTLILDTALAANTNVHYEYTRVPSYRDLYCLLEDGPRFDFDVNSNYTMRGYVEALRFVCHDPFWYGEEQYESWITSTSIGDLIFDVGLSTDPGAWFGEEPGVGRWLFSEDYVGQSKNIVYWGHELAVPIIEIQGTATNITVTNSTVSSSLFLDYSIALGETVTIDPMNQSVTNNFGADLSALLTGDMSSYGLYPETRAPNKTNSMAINYSDGTGGVSRAIIKWKNKYATL